MKGEWVRKRKKKADLYYERSVAALEQLLPKAKELGIILGVEGRSHFEQVPNEEEAMRIMNHFKDEPFVRYWHDFGHIQRKHNMLLLDHEQFIRGVKPYIGGSHVNDVKWLARDHQIPFHGGDVKFDQLLPYFEGNLPFVWELSSRCEADDIKDALDVWKEKYPQTVN